jgi:hypothetical protein
MKLSQIVVHTCLFVTPKHAPCCVPEGNEYYVNEEKKLFRTLVIVYVEMASVSDWMTVLSSGIVRTFF